LFPSEILAAAIQQLVDNATLPVLFMRTVRLFSVYVSLLDVSCRYLKVIQAIKTYKTLIPYVAGGLMTRLIQKKIWTIGKLWDGFVLCGKIIAPASYPSLLLLPATQLAEVAEKHPALRVGLREYVLKKGGNTSRYLDVLGREESGVPAQSATS
jgi:symplekin